MALDLAWYDWVGIAGTLAVLVGFYLLQAGALLRKARLERHDPSPGRTYATATVTGRPSWLNRLSSATRMCNSVT